MNMYVVSAANTKKFLPCSTILKKKRFECDVDPRSERCSHLSDLYDMCVQRQKLLNQVSRSFGFACDNVNYKRPHPA